MDRFEKVEFMNMCMIYNDNNVVIQERVKKDWSGVAFPGGHVEKGESFVDSVIREVKEETGLDIKNPRLCGVKHWYYSDIHYVVFFYKTSEFSGRLRSSEEGEVRWENIDNLPNLNLAKHMMDMIKVMQDEVLSEFYYFSDSETGEYTLK